jgi:hypothetical protein
MNGRSLTGYIVLTLSALLLLIFSLTLKSMAEISEEENVFRTGVLAGVCIGLAIQGMIAFWLFYLNRKDVREPASEIMKDKRKRATIFQ